MHPCPGFMALVTWVKFLEEKLKATIPLQPSSQTLSKTLPLPAPVWPLEDLLRRPFHRTEREREKERARGCSSLTFEQPTSQNWLARSFLRATTVPLFWTISTQFDLRETSSQPTRFLCWLIFVRSLPSSPDIVLWERIVFCFVVVSSGVCNHLILEWIIAHYFMFLCGISFCMYSFDNFCSSSVDKFDSTCLKPISSALALPVSWGRHAKLIDNFSHASDVTSPKTPFSFIIVSHVNMKRHSLEIQMPTFAIFSTL